MLLLILILLVVFGGGFGYVGRQYNEAPWSGPGFGLGGVLLVLLVLYLLGYLHR